MSRANYEQSADLCVLVRGMHTANPNMTQRAIGECLGLGRASVCYYLTRNPKSALRSPPPWHGKFTDACAALKYGQNSDAALLFYELAQELSCKETI